MRMRMDALSNKLSARSGYKFTHAHSAQQYSKWKRAVEFDGPEGLHYIFYPFGCNTRNVFPPSDHTSTSAS